mmetsp:Transcript_28850/g.86965  ORF Transcript_28850/g.86965 Transcript_28850/m.86965 type:complete len:245 (+) Transcript_28850:92-826(+)
MWLRVILLHLNLLEVELRVVDFDCVNTSVPLPVHTAHLSALDWPCRDGQPVSVHLLELPWRRAALHSFPFAFHAFSVALHGFHLSLDTFAEAFCHAPTVALRSFEWTLEALVTFTLAALVSSTRGALLSSALGSCALEPVLTSTLEAFLSSALKTLLPSTLGAFLRFSLGLLRTSLRCLCLRGRCHRLHAWRPVTCLHVVAIPLQLSLQQPPRGVGIKGPHGRPWPTASSNARQMLSYHSALHL